MGARKNVNQDAWCALSAETSVGDVALTVVCDGVGGLSSGELASSTVVYEFSRWFQQDFAPLASASVAHEGTVNLSEVAAVWAQMLASLNRRIGDYGRRQDVRLGTTFTGMLICQGRYVIGHVGDCRVYRIASGRLEQLTNDQTLAARSVAEGTVTKEEALLMPQGSVLLQSVGTQVELRPEFSYGEVREGDLFVTCCDGFYRRLGDEGVRTAYAQVNAANESALLAATERLIQQNMANGEKDNLTAVCLSVVAPEEGTTLLDDPSARAPYAPAPCVPGDEGTTLLGFGSPDDATTLLGAGSPDDATTLLGAGAPYSAAPQQSAPYGAQGGGAPWRA